MLDNGGRGTGMPVITVVFEAGAAPIKPFKIDSFVEMSTYIQTILMKNFSFITELTQNS
jgi:hypothetical protein